MNVILNTWKSDSIDKKYFNEGDPIFERGDYRIFRQGKDCHLYTFKNVAITQLVGVNKELIHSLIEGVEPEQLQKDMLAHVLGDREYTFSGDKSA